MHTIIVDPALIQIPPAEAKKEEIESWLETLTTWLDEALTAPYMWFHCWQASWLLEKNGQFPSFQQLRYLQNKYGLDINVSQFARKINEFFHDYDLDVGAYVENLEHIMEPTNGSIVVEPGEFVVRLPLYLHDNLHLLLAQFCFCKQINHPFGQKLSIAALALKNGVREIAISVTILDALPDFTRPADNRITQSIPLLITPDDLLPLVNILELWVEGEKGIIYAIKQECKKVQVDPNKAIAEFQLGPHFIESVNERGLDTNETMLRKIIRVASYIIADRAKDIKGCQLHPHRESETADSPQLIREHDRAIGWRLMLQKNGAGWRLHYWQIPTAEGSLIEFANISKESERKIY